MLISLLNKNNKIFLLCLLAIGVACSVTFSSNKADAPHGVIGPNGLPIVFKDWHGEDMSIDTNALSLIKPDMYIFRNYVRKGNSVNVYAGYYENLEKSDLIHSPLVCYPGRGWEIIENKELKVNIRAGETGIAQLKLQKGETQHIVIYGYRVGKLTTGNFFEVRVSMIKRAFRKQPTSNFFFRFSTEIVNDNDRDAQELLLAFMTDSYDFLAKPLEEGYRQTR